MTTRNVVGNHMGENSPDFEESTSVELVGVPVVVGVEVVEFVEVEPVDVGGVHVVVVDAVGSGTSPYGSKSTGIDIGPSP